MIEEGRDLAPATVARIEAILGKVPAVRVEDGPLLRLALGVASPDEIQACARALLDSDEARARLRGIRARLGGDASADDGLVDGLLAEARDAARDAGRLLAEGRWSEGSGRIGESLPGLRAAWEAADRMGETDTVEALARALLPPLMEMGEGQAFASLARAARRAAGLLGSARLETWTLSFQGAEASYRGDANAARALWIERLERSRREGLEVAELDTLFDLAGQAREDGDLAGCRARLAEAEPIALALGLADYVATLWSNHALLALDEGCLDSAADHARRAIQTLEGTEGALVGVFVRMAAARVLARTMRVSEAIDALLDVVDRCAEAGRPVPASYALNDLAGVLSGGDQVDLAGRCLAVAIAALSVVGARKLGDARERLAAFSSAHGTPVGVSPAEWGAAARAIGDDLREDRRIATAVR